MSLFPISKPAEQISAQNHSVEEQLYANWKRYGHHLLEYGSEMLGTAVLLFFVVGVVSFWFAAKSPLAPLVLAAPLRLLFAGLMLGSVGGLVAISPPGRLSGAHLNPALSFGFWILGKMHVRDLAGYVTSQIAGGLAGTFLGCVAFHQLASEVHDGALTPGPRVTTPEAFGAEIITTFALTLLIYTFVSHNALMRWTPAASAALVGVLVCLDGDISGAGMNPARWFGPAVAAHHWGHIATYALAPLLGAAIAAGLRRIKPKPHTGKLFHDARYRSIFKHDRVHSRIPHHAQRTSSS